MQKNLKKYFIRKLFSEKVKYLMQKKKIFRAKFFKAKKFLMQKKILNAKKNLLQKFFKINLTDDKNSYVEILSW